MFSKVLILALAAAVANCQIISSYQSGGIPVYRTSGLYGGLYGANGYGYGANLGRVGGLGALRTSGAIIGRGAFGYGTGGYVAGGPAYSGYSSLAVAAPAVSAVKVAAPAVGLGYGVGLGAGYGAGYSGYGAGIGLGHNLGVAARGISVHQAGPVNAAVQTISRTVDYRPVPYSGDAATVQDIDVPPQESPLRINFQSKSSPLQVSQQHIPAEPGQVQVTQSEDEPQQVVHNVLRSVHQQVNEVVQPYRTLTQTVEPVIEQSHTNIAQGEGVHLTGLSSGVIGGTGQIAASGVGVVAPAVGVSTIGVARPAVAGYGAGYGLGYSGYRSGLYGQGLGYGVSGLYGSGYGSGYRSGYGSGLYGNRLGGYGGYGSSIYGGYGGLGYGLGNGLYGNGYGRSYGSYGTYGSGLGLNALSGLSTYGTTSKIARVL